MPEFAKNAIITFAAAVLAFLFTIMADVLRRKAENRIRRKSLLRSAILEFEALQQQLNVIKSTYELEGYFAYLSLNQVDKVISNLDALKAESAVLGNEDAQQSFFEIVTKLSLLSADMRAAQKYEDDQRDVAASRGVELSSATLTFIRDKKSHNAAELRECNRLIETIIRDLRKL